MLSAADVAGAQSHFVAVDAIRALATRFHEAGLQTPDLDARLLVLAALGMSHEAYILDPRRRIPDGVAVTIEDFAVRRLCREPVSRIIGKREFWGRDFALDASTLDPRPDTEVLVEAVLASVEATGRRNAPLRLLDLGTGTGCILLSLLAELPNAWGVGVDIAPQATAIAQRNAQTLGLARRASFCCGDWVAPFFATFDYILSNPPYIRSADIADLDKEVSDYDPLGALDGGADGFDAYRRIAKAAMTVAAPGCFLALEAGAGQMRQLCDLLVKAGWQHDPSSPRIYKDLLGHDRVVVVRKHG